MEIQLTVRGGIYGTLTLEKIDTEAEGSKFPNELADMLRSEPLTVFAISPSARIDSLPGDRQLRTEQQYYDISVAYSDRQQRFLIPHSVIQSDASVKELVDGIWSRAKPISP